MKNFKYRLISISMSRNIKENTSIFKNKFNEIINDTKVCFDVDMNIILIKNSHTIASGFNYISHYEKF